MVPGLELLCHGVRELEFIGLLGAFAEGLETHREGLQIVHVFRQQAHQQAGVQAAGQQHTHGYIGGEAVAFHRPQQHVTGGSQPLRLGQGLRRARRIKLPVDGLFNLTGATDRHRCSWGKLPDTLEDGARCWHHRMQGEVVVQRDRVDAGIHAASGQ